MRKVLYVLFFLYLNSTISSKDFGLTTKYSAHIGNCYNTYTSLSLEGFFSFYDNMFEAGPFLGIVYSEPNVNFDHIEQGKFFRIDVVDISKTFIGGSFYFYPITFKSIYSPFIGIKASKFNDNKSLLLFLKSGTNMITQSGLYNFKTIDDYEYSILSGIKIVTKKGINIILELEYQHREFIIEYAEYREDPDGGWLTLTVEHSEKMIINAFIIGIGLQFMF